jgi:hypothetical protein
MTSTGILKDFVIDNLTVKQTEQFPIISTPPSISLPQGSVAYIRTPSSIGYSDGLLWHTLNASNIVTNINGASGPVLLSAGLNTSIVQSPAGVFTFNVTPGAGGVTSITGNNGPALNGAVNILTNNSNIRFVGAGSALTLDFGASTNLVLGSNILSATGTNNVGVGPSVLSNITSGSYNTAVGYQALQGTTNNSFNTAVGYQSGGVTSTVFPATTLTSSFVQPVVTGSVTINVTSSASFAVSSGIVIPGGGLYIITGTTPTTLTIINNSNPFNSAPGTTISGSTVNGTTFQNASFGFQSLASNTTGINCCAIGCLALASNTTGGANTAIGSSTLQSNTTGTQNTAVGAATLQFNTIGTNNTGCGQGALSFNTTGINNSAFGSGSLIVNTTGNQNTALGVSTLANTTSGSLNTAVGNQCMFFNTTGSNNVACGSRASFMCTTGSNNTAIGYQSNQNATTGSGNTGLGYRALFNNLTGSNSTAVGFQALAFSTVAGDAFGANALVNNTTGLANCVFGTSSLSTNTTGSNNTSIGFQNAISIQSGSFNTFLGSSNGIGYTGAESSNILIGYNVNGVFGESNVCRIGNGTGTGSGQLHSTFIQGISGAIVAGATNVVINASGQLGTIVSSLKFKTNIADMDASANILLKLRPVTFTYKSNDPLIAAEKHRGLIAEEVYKLDPSLVILNEQGLPFTVKYQDIPIMLVEYVQRLTKEVEMLKLKV